MKICVIESSGNTAEKIDTVLSDSGHTITTYKDPLDALSFMPMDTDLVIADTNLAYMTGFHLAYLVAFVLGPNPPKTLLMSDNYPLDALNAAPAVEVLGILRKPFSLGDLCRVVETLMESRSKCPCAIKLEIFCPEILEARQLEDSLWVRENCYSDHYSRCPKYKERCAEHLRHWISDDERGRSNPWNNLQLMGTGAMKPV